MPTHFDASAAPQRERFDYWHKEVCRVFYSSETRPLEEKSFTARLSTTEFGGIEISHIDCEPLQAVRSAAEVRNAPADEFYLSILLEGEAELEQRGRTVRQRRGHIVMFDAARPLRYSFPERYSMSLLKIPRRMMLARVPEADRLTAMLIDGETSTGAMITGVTSNAMTLDLRDQPAAPKMSSAIVDMVAAMLDVELAGKALANGRQSLLARARSHARMRLDDPDLNVTSIAAALRVSDSTLARLFAGDGTSVMRWLWGERLDAAHRLFLEGQAREVSQVALSCGFSSFSHFSRRFKARFGISPVAVLRANSASR